MLFYFLPFSFIHGSIWTSIYSKVITLVILPLSSINHLRQHESAIFIPIEIIIIRKKQRRMKPSHKTLVSSTYFPNSTTEFKLLNIEDDKRSNSFEVERWPNSDDDSTLMPWLANGWKKLQDSHLRNWTCWSR